MKKLRDYLLIGICLVCWAVLVWAWVWQLTAALALLLCGLWILQQDRRLQARMLAWLLPIKPIRLTPNVVYWRPSERGPQVVIHPVTLHVDGPRSLCWAAVPWPEDRYA